jgi:hypothetical protein
MPSVIALVLAATALGVLVAGFHAVFNAILGPDRATVSPLWTLAFAPLAAMVLALIVLGTVSFITSLSGS